MRESCPDSNEYLFTFGAGPQKSCVELLGHIASHPHDYRIRICRRILDEIGRHLYPQQISEIYSYLNALDVLIDKRWSVPFEFAVRYVEKGLKKGEAFIELPCLSKSLRIKIID